MQRIKMVRVTRKASLLAAAAAGALPSELEDVHEAALLPGYIASLTADAAYVRCASCQLVCSTLTSPHCCCACGCLSSCHTSKAVPFANHNCWSPNCPSTSAHVAQLCKLAYNSFCAVGALTESGMSVQMAGHHALPSCHLA
jgi:hypothetical protein